MAKKRTKNVQPAKKSFFFGPGWEKLSNYIKKFWSLNQIDIKNRADKFSDDKGIMSLSGAVNFVACISLILFGTLFFLIISTGISSVLSVAYIIVYILFFIIWLTDRIYLLASGIFVACPECKKKFLIPTYICPTCNAEHTKLTPGKYGAFHHVCNCGTKMPAHFITKRGKLLAKCPKCGYSLANTETVPIAIPIIGGRSSGKTAFITAFSYQFIEKVAPRTGIEVEFNDAKAEELYKNEITRDYMSGSTRMTQTEMNVNVASAKAFEIILKGKNIKPERKFTLYDVAGESFVENTENEIQLQYTYCSGIIFMLDPLSIPTVRNYLDERTNEIDRNSVGTLDLELVLDAFENKLRSIMGKDTLNIPTAIVISKSDIKALDNFLGEEVVMDYMDAHGIEMSDYSKAQDAVTRQFLRDNGMVNFVNSVDMKFKNNRYFKCSSIGHTREAGKYNPKGVLDPVEWIVSQSDKSVRAAWHENDFGVVERK